MDLRPSALAPTIPGFGLALVFVGSLGFLLPYNLPHMVYAGAVMPFGIAAVCRYRRPAALRPIRLLLIPGVFLVLAASFLHFPPFTSLDVLFRFLVSTSGTWSFKLGFYGLVGSALALKEDPTNRSYRIVSVGAAIMILCSTVMTLISDSLLARTIFGSTLPPASYLTINSISALLIRGPLFLSAVLVLRPDADHAAFAARQPLIFRVLSVAIVGSVLGVLLQILGAFIQRSTSFDLRPYAWVGAVTLLMLFLNSILVSLALRNPGYNSAPAAHPDAGAGT